MPHSRLSTPRLALLVTIAAALVALATPLHAPATPYPTTAPLTRVAIRQPVPYVSSTDTMALDVSARVATLTPYVEVRLRVRRPSGHLIYQKTEVRANVEPGTLSVAFARSLTDLEVRPGRYPLEVRVRATGMEPTQTVGRLLVYDPGGPVLPLAVVVRFSCSPGFDASGRFVTDPGLTTRGRDEAFALTDALARITGARISLAAPPVLLDEWARVASGYHTTGPEGVGEVRESEPVPLSYARLLESLRRTLVTRRAELLDVPYSDPDLGGLQAIGALPDLTTQYAQGVSATLASLRATPSAGTAVLGDGVPRAAVPALAAAGISTVLVRPEGSRSGEGTPASGAWRVRESTLTALVIDPAASRALAGGGSWLADRIFHLAVSGETSGPVVAVVTLGPGMSADAADVRAALFACSRVPWVRLVTVSEAARLPDLGTLSLPTSVREGRSAPAGYWQEVAVSRRLARALEAAAGPEDADAEAARIALLLAESRCWAGPDESWSLADRGRAFASAASRTARTILSGISVQAQDVTLSGRRGRLPVVVRNGSGRPLNVTVRVGPLRPSPARTTSASVVLQPDETYVTAAVDLGEAISEALGVTVLAGDVPVARTNVTVRASYIDRLVLLGTVVLVLVGMLVFIRRRTSAAERIETARAGRPRQNGQD